MLLTEHYVILLIVTFSLILTTRRLDHKGLNYYDESFHAVVAQNLLKHPFKPTLIDQPFLPYDYREWSSNHIWLHKPIVPLWTIAISFKLLGVNTFALRLPSALLAAGAVLWTYLIGYKLFDKRVALLAATFQAINPAIAMLVQGYLFSDHFDVALLFWVEAGVYFLLRGIETGKHYHFLFAGIVQGLAYLSKSYLAGIISGLALTTWILAVFKVVPREGINLRLRHIMTLVCATVVTVAPWAIYCRLEYPQESTFEHSQVLHHLNDGIEGWGAPWDRVVFDYLVLLHQSLYSPIFVACLATSFAWLGKRSFSSGFLLAWVVGVLAPHLLATTKTPSATLIAAPAFCLILGQALMKARSENRRWLVLMASICLINVFWPAKVQRPAPHRLSEIQVGCYAFEALWVSAHLGLTAFILFVCESTRVKERLLARPSVLPKILAVSLIILVTRNVQATHNVTRRNHSLPFVSDLSAYIDTRLPRNAVLIFEGRDWGEHQQTMFETGRTSYRLRGQTVREAVETILANGGIPFVISTDHEIGNVMFQSKFDPRALIEPVSQVAIKGAENRH